MHAEPDDGTPVLLRRVGQESLPELAPDGNPRDLAEAHAGALRATAADHDVRHVRLRAHEARGTEHRLDACLLHAHRAGVAAGLPHRHHQHLEREALLLQSEGIDVDLVLARHAPRRRDLRHSGHRPQGRSHHLIQHAAPRLDVAWSLERERVDLPHGRRIRAEPRRHALRQQALHLRQSFQHACPAFVQVTPFLEDHVQVACAVERHPANGPNARQALQLAREPGRDLQVHVLRALAGPFRPDDHLVVAQVRQGVDRHLPPGPEARETEPEGRGERQQRMADGGSDHAL